MRTNAKQAEAMADCVADYRDGYFLLRRVIPLEWLAGLRAVFDAGVTPSELWPAPRGRDWRHSMLDLDPAVQAVCRLPQVIGAVGKLIGERFFLSQVEGREPVAGCGHQQLHRDMSSQRPGDRVSALAFLDDYGPENGATRIVPGSHRPQLGERPFDFADDSLSIQLSGLAGDILVFDVDLVHAASLNVTGARRRSLLAGYSSEQLYASHLETARMRGVRMDTTERFSPSEASFRGGGADNFDD